MDKNLIEKVDQTIEAVKLTSNEVNVAQGYQIILKDNQLTHENIEQE